MQLLGPENALGLAVSAWKNADTAPSLNWAEMQFFRSRIKIWMARVDIAKGWVRRALLIDTFTGLVHPYCQEL